MTKYRVLISHNAEVAENPTRWSWAELDTLPQAKASALQALKLYPANVASIIDQRHDRFIGAYELRGTTQLRPLWEN